MPKITDKEPTVRQGFLLRAWHSQRDYATKSLVKFLESLPQRWLGPREE
nr:MAG TPA: hypothetical protein [Caudoviricetes sp.]